MLREKIRANQDLAWWATPGEGKQIGFDQYVAFKSLAEYAANTLEHSPKWRRLRRVKPAKAIQALLDITKRRSYHERWWEIGDIHRAVVKLASRTIEPSAGMNDTVKPLPAANHTIAPPPGEAVEVFRHVERARH